MARRPGSVQGAAAGRGRAAPAVASRVGQASHAFAVVGRNPGLANVALARVATVTGRWAATVALAVYAYDHGGATSLGILGVVRILPSALAGPLAAKLLDRTGSDRILLAAGLLRTVAIAGAGVAVLEGVHTAPVFVIAAVESFLSTMVRPLQTAALPFLARTPAELTAANLSLTTIESAGMLLGPILSGGLLALWNPGGVLLVTAAAYLLSALLIARIPAWQGAGRGHVAADTLAENVAGLRAIAADPRLRLVVGLYCAENLVTGALNVLVVISAVKLLDLGASGVGVLNASIGIGALLGALAAAALVGRRRIASGLGSGLVLCGVPLLLIGAHPSTVPALVLLAVLGIGVTIVDFSVVTLLQRAIHEDVLAKVFSVLQSLFVGSIGLGAALAPLLVSGLGIRGALFASGAVLPVLAALLWRRLRPLDRADLVGDEPLDLLRSLAIFGPLDLPALERLARLVVPVEAAAGERIITEGERGDRYYVVREGELEVSQQGRPLRRLHPGDGFGEIALLRDVPRTATVDALAPTRLYALDREHFLEVVNGSPPSRRAADAVVDMRLGGLRSGLATV